MNMNRIWLKSEKDRRMIEEEKLTKEGDAKKIAEYLESSSSACSFIHQSQS